MATKLAPDVQALSEVLTALNRLKEDTEKQWVLNTAAARLGIAVSGHDRTSSVVGRTPTSVNAETTPKEFLRIKNPSNDVQRVACLAFFLTTYRGTSQFKSTDLVSLNTEAAGPRINMSRAVNNATNQNKFLAAAGRGLKQITALGEDVVHALPDQEAVKAAGQGSAKARRKRRKDSKGK